MYVSKVGAVLITKPINFSEESKTFAGMDGHGVERLYYLDSLIFFNKNFSFL